jgi:hypothetical protein
MLQCTVPTNKFTFTAVILQKQGTYLQFQIATICSKMIQITNRKVRWRDNEIYFTNILGIHKNLIDLYVSIAFFDKLSTI